jgi:exodeoxyribonuclease VII small subunit
MMGGVTGGGVSASGGAIPSTPLAGGVAAGGGPSDAAGDIATMTFEQAIARLGEIVESLEEGEQPLEESIALFEEGMTLAKSSQTILDRAERRFEELLGVDSQGKPVVREIEPD